MGFIARVLSFERVIRNGVEVSIVKINPDGGANITGVHFADAGDDAPPLPSDYAATSNIRGAGQESVIGYADPINAGKSVPGEKRIYGRDSSGDAVNEVWLKDDGTITAANDNGHIELKPDGGSELVGPLNTFEVRVDGGIKGFNVAGFFELLPNGNFVINGLIITPAGAIISAGGIDLDTHVHPIIGGSSSPGPTGPPV